MAKLADLMLGTSAGKAFTFQRQTPAGPKDVKVHIRPLTPQEVDRSRVDAESYVANLDPSKVAASSRDEILLDARDAESLAIALRDPEDPRDCWAGPERLRSLLTTTELGLLLKAYHDHIDQIGPIFSTLSPERREALIEGCAKDADCDPLLSCDSRMLRAFVHSMAVELWTARMAKSSPTSDSCEPGTESSNEFDEAAATRESPQPAPVEPLSTNSEH